MPRRARLIQLALAVALARNGLACFPSPSDSRVGGPAAPPRSSETAGAETCELGRSVEGGHPEAALLDVVEAPKKRAWEAALGGEVAARPQVRARLSAWPSTLTVEGSILPAESEAFAQRVARDTWRGLEALTDRENGLPVDHVHLEVSGSTMPSGRVGDYTNVTTIGLRMISIVAARELDYIDDRGALDRLGRIFDTLDGLERHRGFFFNYYDTTSLERTSNLLSFVDSSWLVAGLVVVRNRFPSLAARATGLIDDMDYGLFYDPDLGRMTHGYFVHRGHASRYHYGVVYAESRLGSIIAMGKGQAPAEHWFRMARTFHESCAWQTQTPRGRVEKRIDGHSFLGGWYEWHGIRYVPSWGGSMFEALMPTLVLDEPRLAPESLGANDRAHVKVQRDFATQVLGYPVWGISPSSVPGKQDYGEYGVRVLGSIGYGAGAVTPHASALALAVDPDAALANLREIARRFPAYGEWGFYDAVDPASGAVAYTYLTLDQAMTFVALANHLADHRIQRLFATDPIVASSLPVVASERFFE